jgi:aspartyl-tRNA(Asn)/glutamyl-tRNA(Gln) amidotransferase subunit C
VEKMIKREEIERLGNLTKIDLMDPEKYIKQVEQVLNYFESLDKVSTDIDIILSQELALEKLREDKHIPYEGKLIEKLKNSKDNFIKAPKMN